MESLSSRSFDRAATNPTATNPTACNPATGWVIDAGLQLKAKAPFRSMHAYLDTWSERRTDLVDHLVAVGAWYRP